MAITLWYINIDPGSHRGWKTSFHWKLLVFRVYVNLPGGIYGYYMVNNDYSQCDGKVIIQPCSKPPTRWKYGWVTISLLCVTKSTGSIDDFNVLYVLSHTTLGLDSNWLTSICRTRTRMCQTCQLNHIIKAFGAVSDLKTWGV